MELSTATKTRTMTQIKNLIGKVRKKSVLHVWDAFWNNSVQFYQKKKINNEKNAYIWLSHILFLKSRLKAIIRDTRPSTTFLSYSKAKFRWTSIKCFHDDTPVLLAAVEFVMKTFD